MKRKFPALLVACLAVLGTSPVLAQSVDAAQMAKWSKAVVIHYDVVGEFREKHVQIPPVDADLYADVFQRVRVSFDWDREKKVLVGAPKFVNEPATLTNLSSVDRKCPTGKPNGPYEHFHAVELKSVGEDRPLELIGTRIHPETMVSEACSKKLRLYKGAVKPAKEYIAPMDPEMLAYIGMPSSGGGIRISPDRKSIIMGAQNSGWVWTYTPTPK